MTPARSAVLAECTDAVRTIVRAHRSETGSVKRAVHLAASAIGITPRRVEAYWWGEVAFVQAHEADAVRQSLASLHASETARLAAALDRHREAHKAARHAIRPSLQLRAPPVPAIQRRLSL